MIETHPEFPFGLLVTCCPWTVLVLTDYWVGSLDFNFWEIKRLSTKPQKVNFLEGVNSNQVVVSDKLGDLFGPSHLGSEHKRFPPLVAKSMSHHEMKPNNKSGWANRGASFAPITQDVSIV